MSIYKRGSVYWSAIWVDGKRHMRSLETTNRRHAETAEQGIKEELHARRFRLPKLKPEMALGELYARFLAEADVKPHHLDRAKHFPPFFSDMSIGKITRNDITRYRKHRQEEHLAMQNGDKQKPLSETTINRDIEVLRHLLFWAADEGFIPAPYKVTGDEHEEDKEEAKKKYVPIRSIKTGWAGALRRAGMPHYRFHDLRHTFNSRLVEAGVIADVRKELMGHSRGGDVHSLYTHVELPTLRNAITRLDAWHGKQVLALSQPNQGEPSHA